MGGMKYGYARTSTEDQTTALQIAALKRARCSHIYEDKGLTGASAKRPALSRCLRALRAGDTLIVWKLDRLGRSLRAVGSHDDAAQKARVIGEAEEMPASGVAALLGAARVWARY